MRKADQYFTIRVLAVLATVACGACEVSKSSNPLSPTVQGPIPGVKITAPAAVTPSGGQRISVDQQPITLTVQNATTNGVRPLTYVFEIATDVKFAHRLFSRDSIPPGDGGKTSLRLPDALATGRTYYWRALAQDGANTGDFGDSSSFDVFTPIVINAPTLLSPAQNTTTNTVRPQFTVANATRSGPVGAISYALEVADDFSFANRIVTLTTAEASGQTTFSLAADLGYAKTYYWHVRAADPTTTGPWSQVFTFTTPTQVVEPPPPPPGGPVAADAFDLRFAQIHSSPTGVVSWPVTTTITSLSVRPDGVSVEFSKKDGPGRWPDVVPPGWTGPLQYTLWIAMNIGGAWHTCSPIEFWHGLAANGGDVTVNNQIAANWTYYCGPMARQPVPGEMVGFFVTAGDQRLKDAAIVHERSNTVVIPFPAAAGVTFPF
jgi:hypothetical protein